MGLWDLVKNLLGIEPPEHLRGREKPSSEDRPRGRARSSRPPARTIALAPGLPRLDDRSDLSRAVELDLGKLTWLIDPARAAAQRDPHYHLHVRPKSRGGIRALLEPRPELKRVQRWILREILDHVPVHEAAQGFVRGRSIVTHARRHVGRAVVMGMDFENFFHQFTLRDVQRVFRGLGYPSPLATDFARLCTAPVRTMLPIFARRLQTRADASSIIHSGALRRSLCQRNGTLHPNLPQGAPTSPALSNLICRPLDVRLTALAQRFDALYSRYADDLSFSGDAELRRSLARFVPLVKRIAHEHKFKLVDRKLRIVRKGGRQIVTGLVVNDRLGVPADEHRRLRAILHQCRRDGPESQNREGRPRWREHLAGRIAHVQAVSPDRGAQLRAAFDAIDWTSPEAP